MSAEKWPEKWSDSMCVTMVGVHLNPSDYEHAAKCVNAHEELIEILELKQKVIQIQLAMHLENKEKHEKLVKLCAKAIAVLGYHGHRLDYEIYKKELEALR